MSHPNERTKTIEIFGVYFPLHCNCTAIYHIKKVFLILLREDPRVLKKLTRAQCTQKLPPVLPAMFHDVLAYEHVELCEILLKRQSSYQRCSHL